MKVAAIVSPKSATKTDATPPPTPEAPKEPAKEPVKHKVRFLMSAQEAKAVIGQYPGLVREVTKAAENDTFDASAVSFGAGKRIPPGELDDAVVIGFNLPMNLALDTLKVVEVPFKGTAADRNKWAAAAASEDADKSEAAFAKLATALEEFAGIPTRVYNPPTLVEGTAKEAASQDLGTQF